MKKLMELKHNKNGITLILLVITMIVILILAGISIAILTGDRGILGKANKAKIETENASFKEYIELAVLGTIANSSKHGEINEKELEKELEKYEIKEEMIQKTTPEDEGSSTFPWVISNGNTSYEIDSEGNVTKKLDTINIKDLVVKNGNTVVEKNSKSVPEGTPLTINFNASIENGTITDISPKLPYTPTASNIKIQETFIITGQTKDGTVITRTYIVNLKGYYNVPQGNLVVTYNYIENGGTTSTKEEAAVGYGSTIDLTPTATKTGYTFIGWNTDKDAKTKLDSLNMGTNNITLYAIYSKELTGIFKYWNGSKTETKTESTTIYNKETSGQIIAPTVSSLTGYTSRGWSTSSTANATETVAENTMITINGNTNYYMSYTYTVTLTYNANNGTGAPVAQLETAYMNYESTKVGATITLSTKSPTRSYYAFTGWYTGASSGTKIENTYTIDENKTIYAHWTGLVYAVALSGEGATTAGSSAVYEKYSTGIYKEQACTNQITTTKNAITVPKKQYTLTYNANGGSVSDTSAIASYTFGGYYTAQSGSGTELINSSGNITSSFTTTKYTNSTSKLYAKWIKNNISLATPTRAGYRFDGWFTQASGGTQITSTSTIIQNQTIYAHWTEIPFSTNYGKIDVVWLSDTGNNVSTTPNAPVLDSGMQKVTWTKSGSTWTEDSTAKTDWYNYTAGDGKTDTKTSEWANAKNTADGSYFVWIPRYAYRITYYASETSTEVTGYYDGNGMRTAKGDVRLALESGIQTVSYNGYKYIVHPAFCSDVDLGGWGTNIKGFWTAKYEMSKEKKSGSTWSFSETNDNSNGNIQTSSTVRAVSKPYTATSKVSSWRYITTGNCYTNAYNYDRTKESHLMKNSEWGAIAYLTHSQYGRNGHEIDINGSEKYYTGNGSGAVGGTASTAASIQNYYNTETGAKASTTGNIYGVYDMSGGAWEYVAAWNTASSASTMYYGNSFASTGGTSTKYRTAYSNGTNSYDGNATIYQVGKTGDATKEVNKGGVDSATGTTRYCNWFEDSPEVTDLKVPYFRRGGQHGEGAYTGIFFVGRYDGGANRNRRFPCCTNSRVMSN